MKRLVSLLFWTGSLLSTWAGYAQQSSNVVDYQVTYDLATARYTAWVVPRYNVPNANNSGTTERGGTAQFTIKVPTSFTISAITDILGSWDKNPPRLDPGMFNQNGAGAGLDPNVSYYVIGKGTSETNYGSFVSGTPVALFTFQGNGCFGPVSPLEPGNPIIALAYQASINVASSFYSLSGQPAGGNQRILEQFRTVTGPPAQCSPAVPQTADLLITKQVSQSLVAIGTSVSFTLAVQNLGPGSAVGVSVQDTLAVSSSVLLQGTPAPSRGSFDAATGIWTVGDLGAGEVATLVLTVIIQREGVLTNTASVTATGSQDPNTANNTASSCASVPVRLCAGEEFIASVPGTYQNIQWFRDGVLFTTGPTATITGIGIYTVTSTNGTCPISGCCPIIVESGNCCPTDLCVPLVVRKTRTRL